MFYYFIITLIIFRSPLRFEMVMAATAPVAAAPATATAEGTARGSRRGSRMGEGRKRAQTTGPGILTVYFDCLVHLYTHTYSL